MHSLKDIKFLTLFVLLTVFGQSFGAWDGTIATTAPGDTTIDGKVFYKITNEQELAWFAAQVNSGKKSYNAKLMANLDMGGKLWTPIGAGNNKNNYNGTFDGNEHVISNLYISAEELIEKYNDNDMAQNIGFIGCFSGTVKDLILENIEVHGFGKGGIGNATNLVDKPISIGTVVGWQSTNASVIDGCYATGVVVTSGDGQAVGGIVGNVGGGTVSNCYSAVDIYASGLAYVGGIAGYTKNYKVSGVNGTVTVESCIYAGETLSTEGSADVGGTDSSGRVGAIIGYQYKGNVTLSDLYYDAKQFPEGGVGATTGGTTTGNTSPKSDLNSAEVICLLNGGDYNEGTCTGAAENPSWSMGESGPVLNDYSADGFKITFDANGGIFAENATTAVKYVKLGYVINDDGLAKPSRDDFAFTGWSTNKNATEPDQNLGTASGAFTVYAIWNPIYTITFSATPGSFPGEDLGVVKTVKIEKNKKIAVKDFVIPSFYMDNGVKYSFMGWSTKENPEEEDALVDENGLDDLPIAEDNITLYAVWTEATIYRVTFDANGHGPSIANYVKVKNVYDQEKVTALTDDDFEHADGYSLDIEDGLGWCIDPECSAEFDFNTPIEEDTTLYAKWKTNKYAITYENLNGASNSNPSEYTVDGLALVDPSWDDAHRFLGWFKDSEFKNKVSSIPAGTTGALTLYAGWKTITYAIIYKAGTGGIGSLSPDEKIHGEDYVLPGTTYTRTGYLQSGWSVTDCGEKVFDFGGVYEANKDTSFYPAWNIITYTIQYVCEHDCENLDETKYPRTYNVESSFGLTNLKAINGYKFGGWYKDSEYENKVPNIQKGTTGNLILYGKWNQIYKITYEGTNQSNSAKTYTVDDAVKFNAPAGREGYTFDGWYDNAGFEGDTVGGIVKGSTGDKTFYAKWTPVEYKITYNLNEGTLPEGVDNPQTYTVESEFDLPIPTKDGYDFVNWTDDESGDVVTAIALNSTGAKSFTAHWNVAEYIATYDLAGGSMDGDESFTFTIESEDITLASPTKNGYAFEGWLDSKTDDVLIGTFPANSFGDRTLTAQWRAVEYMISYENLNGAANDNATSYTVEQTVVLNDLEKDGFVFGGWYDNAGFNGSAITEIRQGSVGDRTFYAKWLEIFTITYAAGEGDGITGDVVAGTKTEGEDATLSAVGFARDGYTQTGWKTEDASATYDMGGSYTTDASVTLYPVWNLEEYNITYHNIEGATFETPNPETYTVETLPITLNNPTKDGFVFEGWFVDAQFTGDPITGIETRLSEGDGDLYAKWELVPSTITVTASTEVFEYDGDEHAATCSYEGVIPVGYSIAMTPTGIVQTVGDGSKTSSCEVVITEDATGDDATSLFSEVLEIVNGTISVKAKVVNYGGVAVITDEDGTRAEIDDGAMTKIDIPNDVPVDHVEFNRNFPLVKYATVVLPFTIDTNKVHGAKFYTVVMQKTDGKWVAGASPVKTTQLTANTPYLIFAQDANLTFDGPVTLNTSEINNTTTVNVNEGCSWTFKGTYEKIVWDKDHPDLKKVYAFSAHDVSDDIKIGKFVKFGAESWIRPMRAYLIYEALPEPGVDPAPSPAAHQYARVFKSMPSTASIEDTDMPEWIDVVIIGDDNEETTPIAQMNSRTGEIRMMDGWFDMKGRKLNAKPTVKGIYYHNGQRIIVK